MDAKVSIKTKNKTMPAQNLFRYISFKNADSVFWLDNFTIFLTAEKTADTTNKMLQLSSMLKCYHY